MMDQYQEYIHKSRYARYLPELGRRESWEETVDRYISFWLNRHPEFEEELDQARQAILNLEVMPSMRALMTAGPALDRDHTAAYNCAYVAMDDVAAFSEILHVLMCGTGVGFSVERQYVTQLPVVAEELFPSDTIIQVRDSKLGWAGAFRDLVSMLYAGRIPSWDLSKVRAAGEPLKTFGGRASGPAPLDDLFRFTVATFRGAAGRRLSSIEVHDIVCKIADIVVVGGVRRSALISLSNLTDQRMRHAKEGEFPPHRYLANNSVAYTETPDLAIFLEEWLSLYRSRSGERGIFSRPAARAVSPERRDTSHDFGTNPCSEIILRSAQFCNLTEVVVRAGDTLDRLQRKVEIATFLGTLQSTLTNFRFLRKKWKDNCEEERLLGVSLTGIQDHKTLNNPESAVLPRWLETLRDQAVQKNGEYSMKIGINPSSAITCVKPSGTVSQLVNSASGIHARYAPYYVRRVKGDAKDPLAQWLREQGVPYEPDAHKPDSTVVFTFPIKSPKGCRVEGDLSALRTLQLWKIYQDHWCEHKPSITVHYKDSEFLGIGAWVYENFEAVSGIALLPKDDHIYVQPPYEAVTEVAYKELASKMPVLDWTTFSESLDQTTSSQELACAGGVCEVVDISSGDT